MLIFSGCVEPQIIPDFVVCGWIYPEGGETACSCVHTVNTAIPAAHYGLVQCEEMLTGSVFTAGANFSGMQQTIDTFCTETGSCTYQDAQAAAKMSAFIKRLPRKH